MNSIELNKIACVALFTGLVIFGLNILGDIIYAPTTPDKPAYSVEVAEAAATGGGEASKGAGEPDIATLLASANPEKGAKSFSKCKGCHTSESGGKNGTGPNLYGIVGKKLGSVAGFKYSSALIEKGGSWNFEELDQFLKKPKNFIPKTAMGFAGIKKATARADMIAYLNSNSASPLPFPKPAAVPAAEPAPSAEPADKPGITAPENSGNTGEKKIEGTAPTKPVMEKATPAADKQGSLAPKNGENTSEKKAEAGAADRSDITGSITTPQENTPTAQAQEQKKNKLHKKI